MNPWSDDSGIDITSSRCSSLSVSHLKPKLGSLWVAIIKLYNPLKSSRCMKLCSRSGSYSVSDISGLFAKAYLGEPIMPVMLCAVKTVDGDFRFSWTISPNVGKTHKENPNLVRFFYMTFTLNDIYKQYNKLHKHWYTKISSLHCAEDRNPPQKCIRHIYKIQAMCRALQALYSPQRCELIKKTH